MQSVQSLMTSTTAPLYIGAIQIDPQVVLEAKDHIHSLVASVYTKSLSEYRSRISLPNGLLVIPPELFSELLANTQDPRYYVQLFFRLDKLPNKTPLDRLLIQLSSRLLQLQYPCTNVEIRLENGCFQPDTPYWHIDGTATSPYSITTNFSSIDTWSTWVLDSKFAHDYTHNRNNNTLTSTSGVDIETRATPSELGSFCDASKVFHRSPRKTDFPNKKLLVTDFRLFMRFTNEAEIIASHEKLYGPNSYM